ncbi:MAG TPA: hypothetical protein VEH30_09075, partial [Terriglobales bacterium]|nr:hypothetical protein [Terriglobales bacterium]
QQQREDVTWAADLRGNQVFSDNAVHAGSRLRVFGQDRRKHARDNVSTFQVPSIRCPRDFWLGGLSVVQFANGGILMKPASVTPRFFGSVGPVELRSADHALQMAD